MGNYIPFSICGGSQNDPDAGWRAQNKAQENNRLYNRFINLKAEGQLILKYEDEGPEMLRSFIREEIEPQLHNQGQGKMLTKAEYIRWKKLTFEGANVEVQDKKSDQQILMDYNEDEFNKVEDHEICWDLDHRGAVGETALHVAMLLNSVSTIDISKILLNMYPKLALDYYEGDEYYGESALHIAIVNSDFAMVKLLVESGANVNLRATGRFFLPEDQKNGYKKQTNYDGYAYYGEYPLAFAACFGQEEVYDYLIDHGADPNRKDTFGNTVLHMLVITNQISMFAYAVKHHNIKAEIECTNNQDMTPLTLASKLGRNDIFKEIIEITSLEIWRYSDVTCAMYPLGPLDSIGPGGVTNVSAALYYITNGETEAHLEMLSGGVIKQLLDEKWKTFGQRRFFQQLVLAIFHLIMLSIAIYTRPSQRPGEPVIEDASTSTQTIVRYVAESLVCAYCLINTILQLEEIRSQGFRGFLTNQMSAPAKFIFNISCILVLLCIPARFMAADDLEMILIASAAPGTWFFLMFFARGFAPIGPFVVMIYKMFASDIARFVLIFVVFLIQFSQAFYFLFVDIDDKNIQSFNSLGGTVMQIIQMTFGEFKYEDFDQTRIPELTKLVFAIFAILVPILLLNMLIAMMGNTYSTVIARSEKEWTRQWAKIILVLERSYGRSKLESFQEDYSVPLMGGDSCALMVIKISPKTKARQRKGAISNWKKLVKTVKDIIKEQKSKGHTGVIDLTSSEVSESIERKRQSYTARANMVGGGSLPKGFDEDEGGLTSALTQLAWQQDIDLTKGKPFTEKDVIKEENETGKLSESNQPAAQNGKGGNAVNKSENNGTARPSNPKIRSRKVSPDLPSMQPKPNNGGSKSAKSQPDRMIVHNEEEGMSRKSSTVSKTSLAKNRKSPDNKKDVL